MSKLKCSICDQLFQERLISMRTTTLPLWTEQLSSFKEHASTEKHKHTMILYKKQYSTNVCDYAPIVKALLLPLMDELTRARLKRKFEIAYVPDIKGKGTASI